MGNCGSSFDQTECQKLANGPLNADPDIVGPGVLTAFGLTALITFTAIVIGYLTDSLPREYLNGVDHALIQSFQKSLAFTLFGFLFKVLSAVVRFGKKCLFITPAPEKPEPSSRARREKVLEKFVLALSDQQLVTGTAVLVAAFANHCRISLYEWNVVVSLAWFSAVTHLSTLDVLQRYFRENEVVRNWRLVGMVCVVGFLIAAEFITLLYEPANSPVPLECIPNINISQFLQDVSFILNTVLATVFIICYLIAGYTSRIANLFTEPPIVHTGPRLIWALVVRLRHREKDTTKRHRLVKQAFTAYETDYNKGMIAPGWFFLGRGPRGRSSRKQLERRKLIHHYQRSFLIRIAALVFTLVYGICQVVVYRWFDNTPELESGANRMDFGQIVPLILLLIPALNAAEIFYEKDESVTHGAHNVQADPDAPYFESHRHRFLAIFAVHIILAMFIAISLSLPGSDYLLWYDVLVPLAGWLMGYYMVFTLWDICLETYRMREYIHRAHLSEIESGQNVLLSLDVRGARPCLSP